MIYHGQLDQVDHHSLKAFHYQEKLTKAIQHTRTLQEETQPDINCKINPAIISGELEEESATEKPNHLYNGQENITEK